ncbi:MAG: multiple sugar transport system permease protein [Kosmotogales bacterium]|nr:multiple sugar transport system permease protein [Kosmotogales bacterium]
MKIIKTLRIITIIIMTLMICTPLYWVVLTSFKPDTETMGDGLGRLWSDNFTLDNYKKVFVYNPMWEGYLGKNLWPAILNSLYISGVVTLIAVVVGIFAAYGLTKFPTKFNPSVSSFVLFAYVFPPFILVGPLSILLNKLGVLDTRVGVILAHLLIAVPFTTWMMRSYFLNIPKSLVEAGLIDGTTKVGALFRIVLPLAAPGMVTSSVFAFTRSWADLLYSLVIINSTDKMTLPLAITMMKVGDVYQWGVLMTAALVAAAPPVIIYAILQKYVVGGMTAGAVKS